MVFSTTFINAPAYNPSAQVFKESRPGFVETIYGHPAQKVIHANDPSVWLDSCYGKGGQISRLCI